MNDSFWMYGQCKPTPRTHFLNVCEPEPSQHLSTPQSCKDVMALLRLCGFSGSFGGAVMGELSCPSASWGREGVKALVLYSLLVLGE